MRGVDVTSRWIAYDQVPSPLGNLFAAVGDRGLYTLSFEANAEAAAHAVAAETRADVRRYPEALLDVRYELAEYFEGRRRHFDVRVDLSSVTGFSRRVLEATADIPFGQVLSYGEIAQAVGSPGAARAVGQALNRNPVAIVVPCHRVVGSTGELTGYGGGLHRKEALLWLEGVRWPSGSLTSASRN